MSSFLGSKEICQKIHIIPNIPIPRDLCLIFPHFDMIQNSIGVKKEKITSAKKILDFLWHFYLKIPIKSHIIRANVRSLSELAISCL